MNGPVVITLDSEAFDLLASIARSLEALAADATDRRTVARASLASQYEHLEHLEHVLRQKQQAFTSADHAAAYRNVQDGTWSATDREWHRRTEREMYAAQDALDAFAVAHPDLPMTSVAR